MSYVLITPPAVEPIALDEVKLHCKVEHDLLDDWLEAQIKTFRERVEHETGRALITQTWELRMDAFPAGSTIEIRKPPTQEVESVKYLDADGVEQTFADANYTLDSGSQPARLVLREGVSWPVTQPVVNAVRVRFKCGYGDDAASVPSSAKLWMLMHVAAAVRTSEAFAAGVSVAELPNRYVDTLLDPLRTYL